MTDRDYFCGDLKRLWQDQIAGKIDFDYSNFLGALTDLQTDPDWQQAFTAIENETGMPEFLTRLQQHFDLCRSPHNPDGSVTPYQHSRRTHRSESAQNEDAMIALMQRHLKTAADAVAKAYEDDDDGAAQKLGGMKVSWTSDWSSISNRREQGDDGLNVYIYESMSEIEDSGEKDGTPKMIMSCLHEACYGLAASYDLQRYLMQDFYTHGCDVTALYELEWLYGCDFRFDAGQCLVFDDVARRAHKKAK